MFLSGPCHRASNLEDRARPSRGGSCGGLLGLGAFVCFFFGLFVFWADLFSGEHLNLDMLDCVLVHALF